MTGARYWCVRVLSDDLIAMPSQDAARRYADAVNRAWDDHLREHPRDRLGRPDEPACQVLRWPYGAYEHAQSLDRLRRDAPHTWANLYQDGRT